MADTEKDGTTTEIQTGTDTKLENTNDTHSVPSDDTGSSETSSNDGTQTGEQTSDSSSGSTENSDSGSGSSSDSGSGSTETGSGSTEKTKTPSVTFTTVASNKETFVQGNGKLKLALNEAYKDFGDKKVTATLKLVNNSNTEVNLETIFSAFKAEVNDTVVSTDALNVSSLTLVSDSAREDNASDAITLTFNAKDNAHGAYKFIVNVTDGTNSISSKELPMNFVTPEEALINYETLVNKISNEDISALDEEKDSLESARVTAKNAIDALTDSEKKTELNTRYTSAYDKQNEGYKLYYLYKSKEKHLELYKVKNIGGNVPFAIVFDKAKLVGSAKKVFYYVPNSNEQHIVVDLTPSSDRILFNQTSLNDGEYIYIYKFGDDDYYRTIVTVSNRVITKVDDIDVTGIDEQGKSFTAPGKGVNKNNLKGLLDNANQLVKDHAVGTEVGQVSQETLDNFRKSITSAQTVYDDDDAQEADVTGAVTALTSATQTFTDAIVDYHPNKENLAKAITDATTKVESATVGEEIGQTTQENIDTYKAAIAKAKATMDSVNDVENYDNKDAYDADVKKLDDALTELNEATKTYDSKVVSGESYAEAKLAIYEKAADNFLNSIRKKISI